MKLHPQVVALVKVLIDDGKAGAKPFGVPLTVWQEEINKTLETTA